MLLSPAIVFLLGAYVSFLIVRSIIQQYHHRQLARSLRCEPTTRGGGGFLGIYGFFKLSKAVKEKRWVEFIADQYKTYGNTVRQVFLTRTIISTIEPENIKALLATQFKEFGLGTRHREFYPLLGDGIFTLDGAGWSHSRGLLRPQFARDQVADLDLMDDHIRNLVDLIHENNGISFDIQRLFFLLTIDSATHFLFGESVGSMVPAASAKGGLLEKSSVGNAQGFAEAFGTAQDYLASRSRSQDAYWLINPKEFQDANKRVHEVVDHYVKLALESQQDPEKKQPGSRYIFAEALAAETSDPKVLRDNMLNILLAGRDTTASLLSSVFFYMARNQQVWHRLRHEIIEEFGNSAHPKAEITQAKLKDIPYLRHVLNESTFFSWLFTQLYTVTDPSSPPVTTSRPAQLPRRQQRHKSPPWRWSRSEIPDLYQKGLRCRLQRLGHAPSPRLLRS